MATPPTTAMTAATSPTANVAAPATRALAASTRPRRGLAVSVVRIRPRRYSAVMNMTATTITAISPANAPTRCRSMVCSRPPLPGTSGPMSPDPRTVKRPAAWW